MSALVDYAVAGKALFVMALASAFIGCADAQTTTTTTFQGPAEQSTAAVSRDAFGKACLGVRALARPSAVNADIVDHVVLLQNHCPKKVSVRVCYYNSERCNKVDAQPYKRTDTILGTVNGQRFFRYTVTETNVAQPDSLTKAFTHKSLGF